MVDHEAHHRRIRGKAVALYIGLIPLALAVPLTWLYFSYGVCQETESPTTLAVCQVLQLTPLLPAGLGIAAVAFIIWDLAVLGARLKQSRRPKWEHAQHGYQALDQEHKQHVHLSVILVASVSLALLAWLLRTAYHSTH